MNIAERIKQKRKSLDLSADAIAEKLGISRASYYRYENQEVYNIPITMIEPLSKILHVSPIWLMGWGDDLCLSRLEVMHLKKYRQLSSDAQARIDKLIDFEIFSQNAENAALLEDVGSA